MDSPNVPPGQSDDEIQDLAMLVAENLAKGESPQAITQQLVDSGWKEEDAAGFVNSIQAQLAQMQNSGGAGGGGEGMGWLLWIGALLLINGLSWAFNWGFIIY